MSRLDRWARLERWCGMALCGAWTTGLPYLRAVGYGECAEGSVWSSLARGYLTVKYLVAVVDFNRLANQPSFRTYLDVYTPFEAFGWRTERRRWP